MKLTRSLLFLCLFAAGVLFAPAVRAASVCSDDPERCVERGASLHRTTGSAATFVANAPTTPAPSLTARKAIPARPGAARATKSPRIAPHSPTPPATTPGMGMLLKLSGGNGSEISWFPSKPADAGTGASWIL